MRLWSGSVCLFGVVKAGAFRRRARADALDARALAAKLIEARHHLAAERQQQQPELR